MNTKHFHKYKALPQITKHFHKLQNTSTNTKHLLGWKHLHGDKTLAQIDNNSTNTNAFTNHYTFPQIRNTPTNQKTVAQPDQLIKQLKCAECLLA